MLSSLLFRRRYWLYLGALVFLFIFRLFYGWSKFAGQDEFQVYLIGLKYFTTGIFPYWGPDTVFTHGQIPGGLQGILVGFPFFVCTIPESPYIFLNLLSFSALLFCAWYCSKRIPDLPPWFIYGWLLTSPWTLHFTTHIENPSYALIGAILFFIAIWDLFPIYQQALIPFKISFFFLGFALMWVMQLHMSWVLMLPYIGLVLWFWRTRGRNLWQGIVWLLVGALISGSTLAPLFMKFGWHVTGDYSQNIGLHLANLKMSGLIVLRFFSFSSYEVARFIGAHNTERSAFLQENIWITPIVILLFLFGIWQIGWLIWSFFQKMKIPAWNAVRRFTLFSLVIMISSFCFTVVQPAAHTFYIMLPVSMWYFFYCCTRWVSHRYFRRVSIFILCAGMFFQSVLAYRNGEKMGLRKNRDLIVKAINMRDYTLLGLRRESRLAQAQVENTWKKTTGSTEMTLEYHNSFEYTEPYFLPQNIVSTQSYTGKYACKLDTIQPFCLNFHLKTNQLNNCNKIDLAFQSKLTGDLKVLLITEVKQNDVKICWEAHPVFYNPVYAETWQFVQLNCTIPPDLAEDCDLHVYVWCPEKSAGIAYFDDVRIRFSK